LPESKSPDLTAQRCAELDELAARLGHPFADLGLLNRALAHRSWCAEHPGQRSNERLEFLGDAVLGMLIAGMVFQRYDDFPEGKLSDLRKGVVNADSLADVARQIGLGPFVLLGRGETAAGGRHKTSILADAMEAIIGAVYVDGGIDPARALVEREFGGPLDSIMARLGTLDHKTVLQELVVRRFRDAPAYQVSESGPDHSKHFVAIVYLDAKPYGSGTGRTKKAAEQAAAAETVAMLTTSAGGDA